VIEAEEDNVLYVFIIIDQSEESKSIMNIRSVSSSVVDGKTKIEMKHYLEDFSFRYYIVVKVISCDPLKA